MQTYRLQLQTTTGGLPWEHEIDMASDAMALEYAKRITLQFACVQWFMSMLVWRMPEGSMVGSIRLNKPTATITAR